MDTERRRIFFGVFLSPELRKRLVRIMALWPEKAFIFTDEENLHVKLYYLGFVSEDELESIGEKMRTLLLDQSGFEINFNVIEVVPNLRTPKIIYLSGEPSGLLLQLQERIEKVFSPYLTAKKSFRPHSTLAKIRKTEWADMPNPPEFPHKVNFSEYVDALTLFETVVIDGKRRHIPIDIFLLK